MPLRHIRGLVGGLLPRQHRTRRAHLGGDWRASPHLRRGALWLMKNDRTCIKLSGGRPDPVADIMSNGAFNAGLESVRRPTELDLVVVWEVRGSNMWTDDANVLTYSQRGLMWVDDETMLWQHQDPDVLVRKARQALEIVECQQRRASQ